MEKKENKKVKQKDEKGWKFFSPLLYNFKVVMAILDSRLVTQLKR